MIGKREIIRIDLTGRKRVKEEDAVAIDKPINIFVNDKHLVTLLASPKNLRELALGHLLGEGIIDSPRDIERMSVEGVKVNLKLRAGIQIEAVKSIRVIPTACGASEDIIELLGKLRIPKLKPTKFKADDISSAFRFLQSSSKVFRRTGGTHAAALFTREGGLKFCMEDVGRHNAVDKVIGRGLIEGTDFARCFLVSTGRLSADMVVKCARAGLPLVASKAAPLESGILAAEMTGLTLVGFIRGSRLNVYTHPERVETR
jgi:FdhD protein